MLRDVLEPGFIEGNSQYVLIATTVMQEYADNLLGTLKVYEWISYTDGNIKELRLRYAFDDIPLWILFGTRVGGSTSTSRIIRDATGQNVYIEVHTTNYAIWKDVGQLELRKNENYAPSVGSKLCWEKFIYTTGEEDSQKYSTVQAGTWFTAPIPCFLGLMAGAERSAKRIAILRNITKRLEMCLSNNNQSHATYMHILPTRNATKIYRDKSFTLVIANNNGGYNTDYQL